MLWKHLFIKIWFKLGYQFLARPLLWFSITGFLLSMHMPALSLRLILVFLFTGSLGTIVTANHEPVSLDWQSQSVSSTLNSNNLCTGYYLPYQASPSEQKLSTDPQPLYTNADNSEYEKGITHFQGNVEFSQGDRQVEGDSARFNQNDGFVNIDGHVTMRRPNMTIQSQNAEFNTNDSEAQLNSAQLAVHKSELRAASQTIEYHQDDTVTMRDGNFTFCAPGDNTWAIHSNQIDLDQESGMGEAQNAILKIGAVPVFYLPWMSFPIDDQRRSGFLFPTLTSGSSTGLDVTTPYYLNLAPNYDALITPRFTELGGSSLNTQFRHLGNGVTQKLELDIGIDDLNADKKRWLLDYKNKAKINAQLTSSIDVKRISDFELQDDYNVAHDDYFTSQAQLYYKGFTPILDTASLGIISRQYGGSGVPAYDQLPHATASGGIVINQNHQTFNADYFGDLTRFTRDTADLTGINKMTGIRTHLVPSLTTAWVNNYSFIKPKISLPITSYQLSDTPTNITSSKTRTIAQFEIDSGLLFERRLSGGYLQTLEPRIYYAYAPYQQQDDMAIFDTSETSSALYGPNRFNGFDRIGDTNRVTVGLDSQFLNAKGWQKAKLSVSQMHYFNDRQVQVSYASVTSTEILSPIFGTMAYNFSREWTSNLGVTWSPSFGHVETTSAHMKYQPSNRKVIDFNYTETRKGVQQAEVSLMWPIAPQWTVLAKRKEDIRNQQLQDEIVGVRYINCCWQASLINRQWLVDDVNGIGSGAGIEHGIFLELSLKGLGQTNKQLTPGKKQSLEVIMKSIAGYNEYVNESTQ
jgi:LPS-assembly protein